MPAGARDVRAGLRRLSRRSLMLFLLALCVWAPRAVHPAEAACTSAPEARPWRGPLFDAMAQLEGGSARMVANVLERVGVERLALFARLHPKRNGEADVLALQERYPQRIVLGTPKPFDQRGDLNGRFVQRTLASLQEGRFRFVGELLFAHADKAHGEQTAGGERYVVPDGPQVLALMAALEERRIPVMTHWEVYDWQRDWPLFHALYARFPDATFIWPHAGFASQAQLATVLAAHPNVVVTLSKKEKAQEALSSEEKGELLGEAIVDSCGTLLPEWRELLLAHPERFLFATDAHKDFRWARYGSIVRQWRGILGQLPAPVAEAIAWRNAERVYGLH